MRERLRIGPTATLSPGELRDLRELLDKAFCGDFSDDDWDHALGGLHFRLFDEAGLLAHGSVVERTLVCSGISIEAAYVEAVATRSDARRNGHGTRIVREISRHIREAYPLGALSTGAHKFYERLGWELWNGPTAVAGLNGPRPTPDDDGGVMILRTPSTPAIDPAREIVCDPRPGDVW